MPAFLLLSRLSYVQAQQSTASWYVFTLLPFLDTNSQAIGLALSLRRLDLVETFYKASRAPTDPTSSTSSDTVQHDEGMLRYVLNEAISGTSGNENWPTEFRDEVSPFVYAARTRADD